MHTIRPITTADLPELQRISRITFKDTFDHCTPPDDMARFLEEAYALDVLEKQLNNPESFFYFIEVAGTPAGYLKLNIGSAQVEAMTQKDLELERLYILPEFQGEGLGKELMNFAHERARELGKERMWLGVWEGNVRAQTLYKSYGFTKFGAHTFPVGNDMQTDFLMIKELGS